MDAEKLKLLGQYAYEIEQLVKKYEDALRNDSVLSEKKEIRLRLKELREKIDGLKNEIPDSK